jgi:branched-chain amino acid aminotransferase
MNECFGKKFILNGKIESSVNFDNSLVYEGESVYEVLRMINGTPVFFDDHMDRLAESVRLQKKKMLADLKALKHDIINISRSDRKKDTNLKIVFNYNGQEDSYLVYFIESIYPTGEQYSKGVKGILYYAERKDPGSKVINHKLRSSIFHKLILDGGYEALLVNEKGRITEGSRSNIFFIKNNVLVTAPDSMILNGITRKHILELCKENDIRVRLMSVKADNIGDYDAVFMTGTSPMVLPFNCIDDKSFRTGLPIIKKLRDLYIRKAEMSIVKFRSR